MAVKVLFKGSLYNVCGWLDEEGNCTVELDLADLAQENKPDFAAMIHILKAVIPFSGPPQNVHQLKYLTGSGKGLIELRARRGTRILGFIDGRKYPDGRPRLVICTHLIPKLVAKRFDREVAKAQTIKEQYFNEGMEVESPFVN